MKEAIKGAIALGAPAYNRGNKAACYYIYRRTAEEMIKCLDAGVQSSVLSSVLSRSRALELERRDGGDAAAWALRHAERASPVGGALATAGGGGRGIELLRARVTRFCVVKGSSPSGSSHSHCVRVKRGGPVVCSHGSRLLRGVSVAQRRGVQI